MASSYEEPTPSVPEAPTAFDTIHRTFHDAINTITNSVTNTLSGTALHTSTNRFASFAPPRSANDFKWYVDGCSYFWAVSLAIERAHTSIWILDWWLSPELYLRRPPSKNESYRLDRMLKAAAERGVKVNVLVYKEVTTFLTLDSDHTQESLEALHPNISVFRHPDHYLTGQALASSYVSEKKSLGLKFLAQLPLDSLKALYGASDDVVLYWAHHEKLLIVDGETAFMGGLDLCFGRWDTNDHPIADAHPEDLEQIVFPGQDFNNARVYDFHNVSDWENNKLDRTTCSRMGWSDVSIGLTGPVLEDLRAHFVQRWNYIFNEKYDAKKKARYTSLSLLPSQITHQYYDPNGSSSLLHPQSALKEVLHNTSALKDAINKIPYMHLGSDATKSGVSIQLVRSCTKWSADLPTEHSIQNAYCEVIRASEHYIYIENQFFITATGTKQKPVENQIGAAIVERIIRAHRNNETYKMIILIPSVPAFAGDLQADESLGTRAIMEYQYNSISRGGHSILEELKKAGVQQPSRYIRWYNLRNYDRINNNKTMAKAETVSGVKYEEARKEHDDIVGAGYSERGERTGAASGMQNQRYEGYQAAAEMIEKGTGNRSAEFYDTVSACYMLDGPTLSSIPWTGTPESEIAAFVSEELYIHTKLLIADDRIVICGSANLNDRSQLGSHDSEIAVVVEDREFVDGKMNGQAYKVGKHASSLRRQLMRKHMGLLKPQDYTQPDANFMSVSSEGNAYDWGSKEDVFVEDIFSLSFTHLWNGQAKTNTQVFKKVFHAVPDEDVRNWKQYDEFYGKYFVAGKDKGEKDKAGKVGKSKAKYEYGHVVKDNFHNVKEVKELLDQVRGTLVEMPIRFMDGVDFAKEGLLFNAFTDEVYT